MSGRGRHWKERPEERTKKGPERDWESVLRRDRSLKIKQYQKRMKTTQEIPRDVEIERRKHPKRSPQEPEKGLEGEEGSNSKGRNGMETSPDSE